MSRIARDSPGMRQNVPRPGQVHSGTMKRPGMKLYRTKSSRYIVAIAILFFQKIGKHNYFCNINKYVAHSQSNSVLSNPRPACGPPADFNWPARVPLTFSNLCLQTEVTEQTWLNAWQFQHISNPSDALNSFKSFKMYNTIQGF